MFHANEKGSLPILAQIAGLVSVQTARSAESLARAEVEVKASTVMTRYPGRRRRTTADGPRLRSPHWWSAHRR